MKLHYAPIAAVALSLVACNAQQHVARLEVVVEGSGTTTPAPGSYQYTSGATVKVTATPRGAARFDHWSGAATGSSNPLSLVLRGAQSLTAHFSDGASSGGASSSGGSSSGGSSGSSGVDGSSGGSGSSSGGSSSSSGGGSCSGIEGGVTVALNAGGDAVGAFLPDAYYSGGSTYSTTSDIDTSLISCNPPPASVFQTERYGEFTYTITNRTPGTRQTVTLFFAETFWTDVGQRTFDVTINGNVVLTTYDIFAVAGGANKAIAVPFNATPTDAGEIVIGFRRNGPDEPKVNAITVEGSGGPASSSSSGGGGGSSGTDGTKITGPCDLYEAGGTPCVAAHSTVRALYGAFTGNLYRVKRASDGAVMDVGVLAPGGFADSATQDSFCSGTTCTISILYDQSPKANHLTSAPAGGAGRTPDREANAAALKLNAGGHPVYALFVEAGVGYRNNHTTGVATGDQPEGMYMVASGTRVNDQCCFDYGNAETNNLDNGNGTMEAIYLGTCKFWGRGGGSGPWVMADLENGLFAGGNGVYDGNTPVPYDYVTAMVKGKAGGYAIKGGDAQSGSLKTMYDGARPTTPGYDPMKKEGAIILGIGGDNSNLAIGTFFEGCMTSGYPSDATEDAVQANIVAAGYGR